jgi:hypothetical protein
VQGSSISLHFTSDYSNRYSGVTVTISALNAPPTVNAGSDKTTTVNVPIAITGTASDSDGSIASYEWRDANGNVLATTASFDYTPTNGGNHILTFKATDNLGTSAEDTMTVTVPAPPLISDTTFTITTTTTDGSSVGTVSSSLGTATSFTINSGNDENLFSIDNTGIISVTNVTSATSYTYILNITASNTLGNSSANITIFISQATVYHLGIRPFELINPTDTRNIIGNTQIIGNTVQCVTTTTVWNQTTTDYSNLNCTTDIDITNNDHIVKNLDIDNDTSTFNSTSATLQFPATYKKIVWAGLFWQGNLNNGSLTSYIDSNHYTFANDLPTQDIKDTNANQVQLQIGNSAYQLVSAQQLDYRAEVSDIANYSSFANVTRYFGTYSPGSTLNITLANLLTSEGQLYKNGSGTYGAWSLVIVYAEDIHNNNSQLRNNSIYSGYLYLSPSTSGDNPIDITGLLLPRVGTINSQMSVFSAEGEHLYRTDSISLDGNKLGGTQKDNIFDGQVSSSLIRNPNFNNTNGIDIDVFDTSTILTNKRDANPNAVTYSAQITLETNNDVYYPSMVSFSTELYKPRVCYYINTIKDSNGTIIFEDSKFKDGSEITSGHEYKFNFLIANMKKNSTDNNIEIAKLVQIYLNMTNIEYISSSTSIKNVAQSTYTPVTDIFADDLGEYDSNASTWRVGVGASSSQGGTLNISSGFTDTTHNAFVEMNGIVNVDGNATNIDLTDFLEFKASFQTDTITIGENNAQLIPQCQDQNTSIGVSAPSGAFNVVSSGFTGSNDPIDQASSLNALSTQVSARNFTVKVLSLDINSITLKPYTGDVTVSIINTPSFTGNASADAGLCKAGSPINTPQTITFSGENSKSVTIINTSDASKSASFQIISDLSGTPVYTCSRDVFAIRPEKFILTAPAGEDIELLTSAQNYNLSLKAVQNGTTTAVNNYNVPTVNSSTFNLKKTLYKPDGTADATLSGALSFLATSFSISNGKATNAAGINFNDVGKVNIQMVDKTWAQVDINNGDTVADCSATGAYICGNINAIFIPNSFALTTVSLFDNNITNSASTYLSNDLNMSAHVQLTATAKNKLNATTSNFKQGSWENPVDINIALVTPVTGMTLNKDDVNETLKLGFTGGVITIPWGETNSSKKMMFNFQRTVNTTKNPFRVLGSDVNVTASSLYTAPTSGNTKTVTGSVLADQNATFVYGRTNAPRQSFVGPNGNAFIYYEAYCNGTDATGAVCDKTLLPNGLNSKSTNDSRWFKNSFHVAPTDGKAGTVTQKDASGHVSVGALDNSVKGKTKVPLTYNLPREYPYETTMENNASRWLIYNQYKAGASKNEFQVEFLDAPGDWAGQHETNNTTKQNASNKTTRRVMW